MITDGLALGYRYDPSPIVWPDGTPAPEDTVTDYHPTARPGSRAPHAWHRATGVRPSICSAGALC